MPRYPWIPPAKPRRIPSTRPVTILDTPPADGGWEYRVSYCGIPLQVFSQRPVNGDLLKAGDTIIARWVPGAAQLWFPSPEAGQELYFTPGGDDVTLRGELWKLTAAGVLSKVWTATRDAEGITCIWWSQIDKELYFATYYANAITGLQEDFVYRFNRSTNIATQVAHWTVCFSDPTGDPNPVMDVAEYGNYIYLHCAYTYFDPYCEVLRFDPVAGTVVVVFQYPAWSAFTGGIAVDPNGPALVASSGYQVYRSPTGDLGSWVLDKDINADLDQADSFSLITHKGDNFIYLGGVPDFGGPHAGDVVLKRTAPATWAMDLNHVGWPEGVTSFTVEYDNSGAVTAIYAQLWNPHGHAAEAHVYRKPVAGVWAQDWLGPADADWVGTSCQGLAQFKGKIYGLWYSKWGVATITRLYRRDAVNNWVLVHQFDNYTLAGAWNYAAGMAVAPNNLFKCHEV